MFKNTIVFENEDGSVEEWDCPPITYVKNRRFIHQNSPCDIFSGIGFRKNKRASKRVFFLFKRQLLVGGFTGAVDVWPRAEPFGFAKLFERTGF